MASCSWMNATRLLESGSRHSRTLLIELEKAKCITILATNRVIRLEPSLDRRISMKVPFSLPDERQREEIWRALIPPNVSVSKEVDFKRLAKDYVFSGGLIKNAIFMAITQALSRDGASGIVLSSHDIEEAARCQTRTMLNLNPFGETYSPRLSIHQLPLRPREKKMLYRFATAYRTFGGSKRGMRMVIASSDIQTAMDCVEAVAQECQLEIRRFDLSDLLQKTNSSARDLFS